MSAVRLSELVSKVLEFLPKAIESISIQMEATVDFELEFIRVLTEDRRYLFDGLEIVGSSDLS